MENQSYFAVTYRNPEKLTENLTVNVKTIKDSSLGISFVSLSDFLFSQKSIIVDPKEDQMRQRFEKTRSLHLSIHHIVSIEEKGLENEGLRFVNDRSNVLTLGNGFEGPETTPQ